MGEGCGCGGEACGVGGMRILQTPVRFHPYVGGVENYVYYLSKELVKRGHEVKVVCANEGGGNGDIDGVKVKRLNYVGKIANTNITPSLPFHLLKEDFDVIHIHLPTPWSADWSALISAVKRKPMVLTYHNDITGEGIAKYIANTYNQTLLKIVLNAASKIIITQPRYLDSSPYLTDYKNKIEVIPNGVDIEKFRPMDVEREENTLFFLSVLDEFHKYKGLEYLLKALKLIKDEMKVKLIVGGEGSLLNYYKDMAKSLGVEDSVDFVGFIPDEKIVEYYNKCDVFVLPSTSSVQEGFGIVLLEAMACGRSVVSTSIVGVAEDIEKYNAGKIVRPKDPKALAGAIMRILQNEKGSSEMGKNGRGLVEDRYTWKRVAEMVVHIYRSIL